MPIKSIAGSLESIVARDPVPDGGTICGAV
jgi:hypothetical protein